VHHGIDAVQIGRFDITDIFPNLRNLDRRRAASV